MVMLWSINEEIKFFQESLKYFATPEQLFYKLNDGYFAYIPKYKSSEGKTLQSRNALIGQFTEKWVQQLFSPIAEKLGLHAVNNVVCESLGLTKQSPADMALCTTDDVIQKPSQIKLIFEIKMSIVSNYFFTPPDKISYLGDYTTHRGNPSLLRSDSMLKAIGKSINIRVSGYYSSNIPIVVLGNSPISRNYVDKVDFLKKTGVIQGFWSLYSEPTKKDFIKTTTNGGFITVENVDHLFHLCKSLLEEERFFISAMLSKIELASIIKQASLQKSEIAIAEKFLMLIRGLQ